MENLSDFFELIKIFVLSVVQGITEWLPISSTGHMIILEDLIPLNLSPEFIEMFFVLVQLGSVIAVLILYFSKLNPISRTKTSEERQNTWILWLKVAFASIPVFVIGLAFNAYINDYLYNPLVVSIALIVYGVIFILNDRRQRGKHAVSIDSFSVITFATALKIGVFQALSIIPGTSRSGSTIIGGLYLGASRQVATEFSFFLSIPAIIGASIVKLLDLGFAFTLTEWLYLGYGMLVAFIVSLFAIRFLINYIQRHDFTAFGYYRIILGVIVISYSLFR